MLTSITPLGERGRNRRWSRTMVWYTAGSILGGLTGGIAAGGLGAILPTSGRLPGYAVAVVLLLVMADELGWVRLTPLGRRQVNEDWLDEYRGWVVGAGFGFQLGLGFTTIVTTLALPAAFLLALLTSSWQWGAMIGLAFGAARALPILAARHVEQPAQLASLHRSHDRNARRMRMITAAATAPLIVMAVAL